ncbi:NAD(P)/FAD-dependent oxidoreductase [Thermosediminibacter litoriperuensis]|uniref:Glycerol-3-phosphate dehydrogenase n=1 Tax=Thermosediminibacter litoriperuensis TaxID=291989 RepID=A0A5S5B004_9FIRM|nr:NAD(P)/FAD-dependent oxidoreductase [Thermosediminibacter litoriperuensis]TYP58845.1 glycerol-3-phosphate dehydrogenase [Thermosediminibacter litoriperuensis]
MVDVVIIGGGVVGCMIARELSRYQLKTVLLEKEDDVASGTSKANSAIIHAGYDAKPGTLKAKLNVRGNPLFDKICSELDVPFKRIGSLVVALNEEEVKVLEELLQRGKTNGVPGLEIINREKLMEMEPNISREARAALYAPTAGIVCPYELTIALAENASRNGVEIKLNSPVLSIGVENGEVLAVRTPGETIYTRYVVNAAGLFADEISRMAGAEDYRITPRKGEYLIFDRRFGGIVNTAIFPTPTKISKGILVCPTVDGNFFIGPNSNDVREKDDVAVTQQGIEEIIKSARKLVPELPLKHVIASFAGLRAVSNTDDFVIGASKKVKGFINVGGIQSPGLSSAPAIAEMVVGILKEEGLELKEKSDYNPERPQIFKFRRLSCQEKRELIRRNPAYGRVICRCETVTEGEIIDAIRRPVGARSLDAVKRRTRAGMGRCQGGFCSPRVVEILARELGIDPLEVTKCGSGSEILRGRTKEFIETGGVTGAK